MQNISVPISEVVSYLDDTLDLWPRGHNVESSGPARNEALVNAAAAFAKAYIRMSMRHVRRKPDPLEELVVALGYPVKAMSEVDVDELCNECDEHYLAIMMTMDPMIDTILRAVGNRTVEFRHIKFTEDLIIEVKSDQLVERYKDLLRQVKRMTPPKMVQEIDDLDEVAEYIDYCINEVFSNINNPVIKDEVKRMYMEQLSRQ
ncbi:hypothetical protein D3C81_1387380 [compost metagenome]